MARCHNIMQIINVAIFILRDSHFPSANFQIIGHYCPQPFHLVVPLQTMNFQVSPTFTFTLQFPIANPLYYFMSHNL